MGREINVGRYADVQQWGVRVLASHYDYRRYYVAVMWNHDSDSACGRSRRSVRVPLPLVPWRVAHRYRRTGLMQVHRAQRALYWWLCA